MIAITKTGEFLPSKLATELRDGGVDVAGVTCTEDDTGTVTEAQIVCADDTDQATVDLICAAHDPTPPAPAATLDQQLADALAALPADQAVTVNDLSNLIALLRGA